jgi:hypothetical protein
MLQKLELRISQGEQWDGTHDSQYSTSYCPVVAPLDRRILHDYSILGEDVDTDKIIILVCQSWVESCNWLSSINR